MFRLARHYGVQCCNRYSSDACVLAYLLGSSTILINLNETPPSYFEKIYWPKLVVLFRTIFFFHLNLKHLIQLKVDIKQNKLEISTEVF